MSVRAYLLVVVVCAVWLAARAATQPAEFDFDERAHVLTVAQVREFGGLAPAERFPDIIFDQSAGGVTYHHLQPLPYLVLAGATSVAQAAPTPQGVLGVSRAFAALMALVGVVAAGLAVRNLQNPRSDWNAPAVVTLGLALMPAVHSMAASVTASTWAFAAVGLTTAAATWAMRHDWSHGSTLAVAVAAALVVAFRTSAYPVLLLVPLAILPARLNPLVAFRKLLAIVALVLLVNGWWLARNALVTGDLLGTGIHVEAHTNGGYLDTIRESHLWRQAASAPWPEWTLPTSSDWLWVGLSRMLGRRTWVDPLTLALWSAMVLIPAASVVTVRVWRDRQIAASLPLLAAAGVVMPAVSFGFALSLSAKLGWYAYLRDMLILLIPLVVVVAALADLRHDRLRTLCFGSGLAFAAAANAGFVLAVLP